MMVLLRSGNEGKRQFESPRLLDLRFGHVLVVHRRLVRLEVDVRAENRRELLVSAASLLAQIVIFQEVLPQIRVIAEKFLRSIRIAKVAEKVIPSHVAE